MDATSLPGGAEQDRGDGTLEPLVGIADDEPHAREATAPQGAQEGRPEGAVLGVTDGQPEHLAITLGGHAGGDDDGLGHDRGTVVGLDVGGVEEDVGERDVTEGAVAEAGHDVSSSAQMRD